MKKDELQNLHHELKKINRMLNLVKKRLNEGRYRDAEDHIRGESLMLGNLADKLRDLIDQQDSNV
ncbi:hypothetical protein CJ745_22060 [Salmonella enterica subsp. enterica]|uniref:Uncharacterized protein n=1 Tax=Salmonella enterica TaxID=28901 RepID=A0A5U4CJN4_SALER|nr:hypothetical protein [Salmonella enterica subsp. enterica]EBP8539431.1 hypothetical protein [Salmonella enterica]EBT4151653.1 hypothetical protein [Salmonella enterica subsp. enterica]EED9463780.1 hypothetical protein [Salmonella enterica subsp. enterica serovar Abaetetuba]EEN6707969.1 hypothetical protein [Salmonella enterica subsp. enterica serovar Rubislaw]